CATHLTHTHTHTHTHTQTDTHTHTHTHTHTQRGGRDSSPVRHKREFYHLHSATLELSRATFTHARTHTLIHTHTHTHCSLCFSLSILQSLPHPFLYYAAA